MKQFIFFTCLFFPYSLFALERYEHRAAQTALGSPIPHPGRNIEELLEQLGLIDCQEDSDSYILPSPPSSPLSRSFTNTPKAQRKIQKKQNHEALWNLAWQMITTKEDLNKPLKNWDRFKNQTLATVAAEHKSYQDILILLRTHSANLNTCDAWNHTPLDAAVNCQCAVNVEYLLSLGITSSCRPVHNICSPFHDTLNPGKTSRVDTLHALLAAHMNPNETNDQGSTVLEPLLRHCAGKKDFWKTEDKDLRNKQFLQQRKDMITILLDAGLQPHKANNKNQTALGLAQAYPSQYNPELVEFLKEEIQKKRSNFMKLAFLLLLCIFSPIKCMWFDESCAEPAPYNPGPTLVLMPSTKAELKACKERQNKDLMQCAQKMVDEHKSFNEHITLSNFGYGFSDCTLLTAAADHKYHQNIMQFALAHGADPNQPDKAGYTPLKKAVTSKCSKNVIYLLQHGAKIGDQKLINIICNPIRDEIAPNSTRKRIAILKALLASDADPNEIDVTYPNYSPCLLSHLLCHFNVRIKFATKGPEFQDRYNCFLDQRKQMIAILLEAGLNPFKKDDKGKTDWEKINELKDSYDSHLFNFAQEGIQKRKLR